MKTALLYKTLVVFMMLPMLILASNETNKKGKHSKEKIIKKEFSVNANATLEVDNSYGNIDVITWNENRIVFEITITTNGNDKEEVQKKLDDITIEFQATSNHVSAETVFNKNNKWWKWSKNNINMKINYIIKMPITNNVDIDNNYGSINLDKLEGSATIHCDYGKITTKELLSDHNNISFDYTKNCYFEYIKSGKINADYSDFVVAKTNSLEVSADYTSSKIELAEDIAYNCDYGIITIDNVNNITGSGDYLTTKIGNVYKSVTLKADYGSLKIANMTANANNLTVISDYLSMNIGFEANYNFNFDINLQYASLREHEGFEFNKKHVESSEKYYTGYYGSENSGNLIKINSDYGSVTFTKN